MIKALLKTEELGSGPSFLVVCDVRCWEYDVGGLAEPEGWAETPCVTPVRARWSRRK